MLHTKPIKLAPLPVPTGAPSGILNTLCIQANDVFIDIAVKKPEKEIWSIVETLQVAFILSNIFSLIVFTWLFKDLYHHDDTLSKHLFRIFNRPWFWLSLTPGLLCILLITLRAAWQNFKYPPIRFNRQRREVVYVSERGCRPLYVPWEKVSAGVYQTEPGSPPYAWKELKLGFSEKPDSTKVWHSIEMVSCSSAVSCWESIRRFMEREDEQLPAFDPVEEHKRKNMTLRNKLDRVDYIIHVALPDALEGWTLPMYLARWVEKISLKSLPRAVHEWSAPLPVQQWKTPSDELVKASKSFREKHRKARGANARGGLSHVIS